MPTLSADAFAGRVRDLSAADLRGFVAALWAARGWDVERRPDGGIVAERDDRREVLATVPAGVRARVTRTDDVPADATVVVAPGRLQMEVPDGVEVMDAEDLYELSLYGLPRERADEVLGEYLGVPSTVPPGFDEGPLDHLHAALAEVAELPHVRTVAVLAFVAVLVVGGATLQSGGRQTAIGDAGGRTTPAAGAATVELNVSGDRSTGLGNSPGEWPGRRPESTRLAGTPNVSVASQFDFDEPVLASTPGPNGSVYVGLYGGFLYAFETRPNGWIQVRWQLSFEGGFSVGPIVRGNTAYVGTDVGLTPATNTRSVARSVHAVNATTGEIRWTYTRAASASSLFARDATLYVGDQEGAVHAVNTTGGHGRWRTVLGDAAVLLTGTADGQVYAATSNGTVTALNASTGARAWNRSLDTDVRSSPVPRNGRLYLGTGRGTVLALEATTGATVWNRSVASGVYATPAVANESMYVGTRNGSVYALNATTGAVVWRRTVGGPVFASLVVDSGVVYVGVAGESGGLVALDAATGDRRWRFNTTGPVFASPAVLSDVVAVGDYDGHVYLLERNRSLPSVARRLLAHRRAACGDSACDRGNRSSRHDHETNTGVASSAR